MWRSTKTIPGIDDDDDVVVVVEVEVSESQIDFVGRVWYERTASRGNVKVEWLL